MALVLSSIEPPQTGGAAAMTVAVPAARPPSIERRDKRADVAGMKGAHEGTPVLAGKVAMLISYGSLWSEPARGCTLASARYCGAMVDDTGQVTVVPKKRKGPAPTGIGISINVRLQPDDLELLDLWIATNDADLSRPEAMRRILRMVAMRVPK